MYMIYKYLCLDVHTATVDNMMHITSLNYFPTYQEDLAESVSNVHLELVRNYLILLCLKYDKYFFKMHHRNRENIIVNIPKQFRSKIHSAG